MYELDLGGSELISLERGKEGRTLMLIKRGDTMKHKL